MTKPIRKPQKLGPLLGLLVLCSCATTPDSSSTIRAGKLPADVKMNQNAGRGRLLIVPVRLESGEELPFVVVHSQKCLSFAASNARRAWS